jgi:hypothetical protein
MSGEQKSAAAGRGHVRYLIAFMLFAATTVNYADRASLSIVGPAMQSQLHIDPITLGYIFSAFGWSYVIAQLKPRRSCLVRTVQVVDPAHQHCLRGTNGQFRQLRANRGDDESD